jgi:hypothetical protein
VDPSIKLMEHYARILIVLGPVLAVAAAVADPAWLSQPVALLLLLGGVVVART